MTMRPQSLRVPAQAWVKLTRTVSCGVAAAQRGSKPLAAHASSYQGCLYTAFSAMYGGYGHRVPSLIEAYRLQPADAYSGPSTCVYHDEAAIAAGLRQRGDHTGLLVSVRKRLLVCAQRVDLVLDLPTTPALPLAEAQRVDGQERRMGWRALRYACAEHSWHTLQGHPVVCYRDSERTHTVLFWRDDGEIQELTIAPGVTLDDVRTEDGAVVDAPCQLALF